MNANRIWKMLTLDISLKENSTLISNLSFNFLLCYDNNYNKQAEVAMLSLLNCSDSIINFYIIHSSEEEKYFLSKKYCNITMLEK